MKYLFLSVCFCLTFSVKSQETREYSIPKMEKNEIMKSGTAAYFPKIAASDFESTYTENLSLSPDSAKVYIASTNFEDFDFTVILVQFNGLTMNTPEEKENLLISYLDYLQQTLEITGAAGYGKGHTSSYNPTALGIIDYWTDGVETIAVKGWIVENQLAVMMLSGKNEYPYFNIQEMFLNGIRFN